MGRITLFFIAVAILAGSVQPASAQRLKESEALRAADFLVDIQNESGAIPDYPGSGTANWDSHMEYALWGLATAYEHTGMTVYLDAMRAGLDWLADRQRSDGSWWIGYTSGPPFTPLQGAYGVSATIALFIYDLWWYGELSGDERFVGSKLDNVRSGLGFLYGKMRSPNGTFRSSWVRQPDGHYALSSYRFAADQMDVYLGLRAAGAMLGRAKYTNDAIRLRATVLGPTYFVPSLGRYAIAIRADGSKDLALSLLTVWPQGYLPWVAGSTYNTRLAVSWLDRKQQPDGAVLYTSGADRYLLATEDLAAGHLGVGTPASSAASAARGWMANLQDPDSGGLATSPSKPTRQNNLNAFAVMIWLGRRPPVPV